MAKIRLEDRFIGFRNEAHMDSFWFAYFASINPFDKEGIYNHYLSSDKITTEQVMVYWDMIKKFSLN